MLQIVILICSASLPPADCQRETALDIISGPRVASVGSCGLIGQTTVAATALIGRAAGDYVKISCEPVRETKTAARD